MDHSESVNDSRTAFENGNCKMKRGNVNVIYRFVSVLDRCFFLFTLPFFLGSFLLFFSFCFQLILMDSAQSVNA